MTVSEALTIFEEFNRKNGNYTEEEFFMYTEATGLLIHETNNPDYMMNLGGTYYERKDYDLALKYYEMAAELGYESALVCLGYVWYYGRTGTVDYKKAFEYFSKAGDNSVAQYKIADMYHNGYYVKKDDEKYREIIERLYKVYHGTFYVDEPLPELCTRLARIRKQEGKTDEAISLLLEGKSMLSSRIGYNPFFGNLSIMKYLIRDLYSLKPFDIQNFDFYDLYYLLEKPNKVRFTFFERPHIIESSLEDDGTVAICYDGKWYRTFDDVLTKAKLDGDPITLQTWRMKNFEVL
jgi:tetratricopeptide (TPR) repeat protein